MSDPDDDQIRQLTAEAEQGYPLDRLAPRSRPFTHEPQAVTGGWDCFAYGEGASKVGAHCFFSEHGRVCGTPLECLVSYGLERARIAELIAEKAATGDPLWVA